MILFNVLYKKIIGRKAITVLKPLAVALALYFALSNLDFIMYVDNRVLYYVSFLFCGGLIFKVLSENEETAKLSELLALPLCTVKFNYSYAFVLILYAILTKYIPLFGMLCAFGNCTYIDVLMSVLFAVSGCLTAFLCKALISNKKQWIALLVVLVNFTNVILQFNVVTTVFILACMIGGICLLNPYSYYNDVQTVKKPKYKTYKMNKFVIWRYFIRYMKSHKIYLINTVALYVFAAVMPLLLVNMLPICFAILSINTPIGILVSCEKQLGNTLKILPNQNTSFVMPYFIFALLSNVIANSIAFISHSININTFNATLGMVAVLFAFVGAVITVMLEMKFPIAKWNVESDLWHHPRKYITPAILLLVASAIVISIE